MYSEILSSLRTKSELELLNQEIDILLTGLYEDEGTKFEEILKEDIRGKISIEIQRLLNNNQSDKEDVLKGLQTELDKLKTLKLTLSFEPSEKTLDKLYQWMKANVSENAVLDISLDQSIIGGAIISYGGNYRDFSFAKKLEENAARAEEIIKETLSH